MTGPTPAEVALFDQSMQYADDRLDGFVDAFHGGMRMFDPVTNTVALARVLEDLPADDLASIAAAAIKRLAEGETR